MWSILNITAGTESPASPRLEHGTLEDRWKVAGETRGALQIHAATNLRRNRLLQLQLKLRSILSSLGHTRLPLVSALKHVRRLNR